MKAALIALVLGLGLPSAIAAEEQPTPREVVERGLDAHGGDVFVDPGTLYLQGTATFYSPEDGSIRSVADDYRMWRAFERGRTVAHGADGKVRILARNHEATIFEIGYDGATTWTQDGIMPKDIADAYWSNNFGFGIIRSALDDGFVLSRAPSRKLNGNPIDLIRLTDLNGQETLFGFDQASGLIRYMAFDSPRGFHERLYDDFLVLPQLGWVQARSVTLMYDGVVSNRVHWQVVRVGEPIANDIFKYLGDNQ